MATRRSGTSDNDAEYTLFRGESAERMGIDVDVSPADTDSPFITPPLDDDHTTTSLPTTLQGNDVNLTPIIDESIITENLPDTTSKAETSTSKKTKKDENLDSHSQNNSELLASLPVYFSTSLPSTSSLQIFQYPTYSRGAPLPVPESARSRNLKQAIRYRPTAKRVEVELPLDLRPAVYNLERGEEMAKGANISGSIGPGPKSASAVPKPKVKREYGTEETSTRGVAKKLEKTRLESTLIPHQTQYMVGVIRDKALHLTPVDSIVQLRPSMHYLDALDAIAQQEKRRAQVDPGEETDEGSLTEDGGKLKEKKKAQNLSVSVRGDASGGMGAMWGKGMVTDSRDLLMLADRLAEGERWIDLDWKDEKTDESKKTFDAQLFASSKTHLECRTRPREFLNYI